MGGMRITSSINRKWCSLLGTHSSHSQCPAVTYILKAKVTLQSNKSAAQLLHFAGALTSILVYLQFKCELLGHYCAGAVCFPELWEARGWVGSNSYSLPAPGRKQQQGRKTQKQTCTSSAFIYSILSRCPLSCDALNKQRMLQNHNNTLFFF